MRAHILVRSGSIMDRSHCTCDTEAMHLIPLDSGQRVQLFLAEMRRYDNHRKGIRARSAAEFRYERTRTLLGWASGEHKHRHVLICFNHFEYFRSGVAL